MYKWVTFITLHIINNFLYNVVCDITLPKLQIYTKPLTSANQNIFLSHVPIATLTPHCGSLPL
jgi:hypothetical protein